MSSARSAPNFGPHPQRVLDGGITPDVTNPASPYAARSDSRAYHAEHGIVTESYSPLGASSGEVRTDPVIADIAAGYGKSPTQIILRWHTQLGLVPIPRSGNPGRIAENLAIFDFTLDDADMTRISALDRGEASVTDSDVFGH